MTGPGHFGSLISPQFLGYSTSFLLYLRQNCDVDCNGLCQSIPSIPLFTFFLLDLIRYPPFFPPDATTGVLTCALTTRGDQVSGYHNEDDVYCTVINLEVQLLYGWPCQHYHATRSHYTDSLFRLQPPSHNNLLTPYSIFAYMLVILCASAKLSRNQ
jgi:hypothetical protein